MCCQLLDPPGLFGLLGSLLLLRELLHQFEFGFLVAYRRVVILVEVDLAQQQNVLPPYQKYAVGLIRIYTTKTGVLGVGNGGKDALDGGLQD